ncbi:MAG: hypothetical protein R3286_09850 [Gammaproteobacteria bacterium]|nr:hypothetical protein [Gammaproteobacteria bacterium]
MALRVHLDKLGIRLGGTALGVGWLALGAYALLGADGSLDALTRERALGFGVTFLIAGLAAIAVSWLVADLSNIWCRHPRARRRGDT